MPTNTNPYLTMSGSGTPVPRPLFNGVYSPAITKMAKEFAKNAAEFGTTFLGNTGLLDSSFKERVLTNAYSTGFEKASGLALQEQNLFSNWARDLMQMKAAQGAEPGKGNMFQKLLSGAAAGAGIGGMFRGTDAAGATTGRWAPLIGAGVGALSSFFF